MPPITDNGLEKSGYSVQRGRWSPCILFWPAYTGHSSQTYTSFSDNIYNEPT